MKKLITLILALAGMVGTASADEHSIYLRCDLNIDNVNGWKDSNSQYKFHYDGANNSGEDVYTFTINSTSVTNDINFRIWVSGWDYEFAPTFNNGQNDGYTYSFSNGQNETYTVTVHANEFKNKAWNGDWQSADRCFKFSQSSINASQYKITLYITGYNTDDKMYIKGDIVSMPLTISDASGYATFSCDRALDFSSVSGLTAYVASAPTSGNVTMTEVSGAVPANTGLFIKGTASATPYEIPVITTSDASSWSQTNYLHPTDGSSVDAGNYVFAKQDDEIGFYKLGAATAIDKGKAYLNATAAGARLSISFNDAAAITSVKSAEAENSCFDLQGRRVVNPTKGLYIINGKKVIK